MHRSAGCNACWPEFRLRTHRVEEKNLLLQAVLWHAPILRLLINECKIILTANLGWGDGSGHIGWSCYELIITNPKWVLNSAKEPLVLLHGTLFLPLPTFCIHATGLLTLRGMKGRVCFVHRWIPSALSSVQYRMIRSGSNTAGEDLSDRTEQWKPGHAV